MIRIDGGGASGEVDFEPVSNDELNEAQAERAQKAALDNAGVTGNSGFSPSPSPSAADLSGNATVAADNGLGTFRASQLIGVSSANLSGVASSLSAEASTSADAGTVDSVSATAAAIVSGDTDAALSALSDLVGGSSISPTTGRAHALSTRGGDGADGTEGVEGTEGVDGTHVDGTGAPTPGPYPGVEVRLNGEVLSLNDAIARGSQLPMRDQMTLVMQLVDQNLPAPVPGGSPMTVNGINLAVTTHKDFDFAAAVQRLQSPGGGNSEDRAIVQSELLAQMGVPRDRMQISYGSFCDPSGKKLYSQAELLVCVPDRPLPQPNAEAPSTWYAMEKNAQGQPAKAAEFAGREWHYADGKVSYLPSLDYRSSIAEPIPVDNSKGFFVPLFGVQLAPDFNRGHNVIDYSKAQELRNTATGGQAYVSLNTAYALTKFAPPFVANGSITSALYQRYESECQARAFAQLPSGAPRTLDYLTKVQDWSSFSRDTLAHLGLPASAAAPFEAYFKSQLGRAQVVQASFNVNLSGNFDWTKPKYADGTEVQTGSGRGLTVDADGYLVGLSLSFDDAAPVTDGDGTTTGTDPKSGTGGTTGGTDAKGTDDTTPVMTGNGYLTNASFIDATTFDPDLVATAGATFMQPLPTEALKNATIGAGSLVQTNEGNCWVLSPLDSIARTAPGFLDRNITFNDDDTVTVKLYRVNEEGTGSDPIFVKMQATVPKYGTVDGPENEVVFGKPTGDSDQALGGFKAALFQKAIAIAMPQLMGSASEEFGSGYRALGNGGTPMLLMSFLGGSDVKATTTGSSTPNEIFDQLMTATAAGDPIVAGTRSSSQIFEDAGLYDSHAYSVIGAYVDENGVRQVRVRNPHGSGELGSIFKDAGPGDNTDTVTKNPNGAADGVDDGIMSVPFDDFIKYFSTVTSIHLAGNGP